MAHNECYRRLPTSLVWWISMGNFVGGVGFWVLACTDLLDAVFGKENASRASDYIGFWSILLYMLTSLQTILLWRGNMYGLALISQLNEVKSAEESSPAQHVMQEIGIKTHQKRNPGWGSWTAYLPSFMKSTKDLEVASCSTAECLDGESRTGEVDKREEKPGVQGRLTMQFHKERGQYIIKDNVGEIDQTESLSVWGILLVVVCIFCGFLQSNNCCLYLCYLPPFRPLRGVNLESPEFRRDLTTFVTSFMLLVMVYMVMLLKSAIIRVPHEKPYRELVQILFFVVYIILLNSIISLDPLWDFVEQFHGVRPS